MLKTNGRIADCAKAIKNMGSNNEAYEMQQLLQLTEKSVRNNTAISKSLNPATHTNAEKRGGIAHALPRVHTI